MTRRANEKNSNKLQFNKTSMNTSTGFQSDT